MNILDNQVLYKKEAYRIVGAAMEVHKILGCGFSEAVYQEAFENELWLCEAVSELSEGCYSQVYNYLKASGLKLGILINFGLPSLEVKRIPCITKWIGE